MPEMDTTASFEILLEALYYDAPPDSLAGDVLVWPVFFKIDGTTVQVSGGTHSLGKLLGTATVTGTTTGVGEWCHLEPRASVPFPAAISQWDDQVMPIPLPQELGGPAKNVAGIFGAAFLIIAPGGLNADALEAGHAAFNNEMQTGLNLLIANHPALQPGVGQDETTKLIHEVKDAVESAIRGAIGTWEKIIAFLEPPQYGSTHASFSQDDLPAAAFDQKDLDPLASGGPARIPWTAIVEPPGKTSQRQPAEIGLTGAISRSRRTVGQGVLHQFSRPVVAVAGFYSPDGYQHAIAATDDGSVTEMYWQGPGQVSSGSLAAFGGQVVGLAGYATADGYQHVIVATDDGTVTELYWQGPNPPGRGALSHFGARITAIAGYVSEDGYQHVVVATDDGDLTELYWLTGAVGQGTLSHLDDPVAGLAGYESGGVNHVFAATAYGNIIELTWSGPAAADVTALAQVDYAPWNHVIGVGSYNAAGEQHVIAAMSGGTLREFHVPGPGNAFHPLAAGDSPGSPQLMHTDLAIMPGLAPVIGAYADASEYQHVVAATQDRNVHEFWWSPPHHTLGPPSPPAFTRRLSPKFGESDSAQC